MVLTITREEVESLVRQKYALPEDIKILIKETDNHSVAPLKVSVNNENFVQDIVKVDKPYTMQDEPKTRKYNRATPEESQSNYERYAQIIEDFLKTDKNEQYIELEGRAPSTMRYRYNTAIKMYGFDDQVYASASEHNGKGWTRLVRKEIFKRKK